MDQRCHRSLETGRPTPSLDTLPRGVHLEPPAVLAGGCRQVFGLTSTPATWPAPTSCRFPARSGPVLLTAVVLVHRCGAVPDSHWVPFSVRQRRTPASPRLSRCAADLSTRPAIVE